MTSNLIALGARAAGTHGLVTLADVRRSGISDKQRRSLVRDGQLLPVGSRAYRLADAPSTAKHRLLAGCLEVAGVATARSSCALHGLDGFSLDRPVEVLVLDGRQSARATLARVHTTTWLPADDVVIVDSIPTLGVARTLFSLAALVPEVSEKRVREAVEEAIELGLATEAWLWWRLEKLRRSGRNGVSVFERVLGSLTPDKVTESWLERETLRVIGGAGLPLPVCQARIGARGAFVARVDFRYPDTMAIIEVNGHRFHASREQLRRDAQRRRGLVALGFSVYDFTYDEVVQEPEAVLVTVRHILGLPLAA